MVTTTHLSRCGLLCLLALSCGEAFAQSALVPQLRPELSPTALAWSHDQRLLLMGDAAGVTRLIRADGGVLCVLPGESAVTALAFAPDAGRAATLHADGALRTWALADCALETEKANFSGEGVVWTGDVPEVAPGNAAPSTRAEAGGLSAVATDVGELRVFAGDRLLRDLSGAPARHGVDLAWTPGGAQILTRDSDLLIWPIDAAQPRALAALDGASRVEVSRDGAAMLAVHGESLRLLDATGAPVGELSGHQGPLTAFVWSPGGRQVATGGEDGTVRLWNADNGALVRVIRPGHGAVVALAWSGDALAIVDGAGGLTVVHARTGLTLAEHPEIGAKVLAFSPDGQTLLTGGPGGARLTPLGKGEVVELLSGEVSALCWSGDRAAVGLASGEVRRFATQGGMKEEAGFKVEGVPVRLAMDAAGERLAVGLASGAVLWVGRGGAPETLGAADGAITALSWSEGLLLSADAGGAVTQYNAARRKKLRVGYRRDTPIVGAGFNPTNPERLAFATPDGGVWFARAGSDEILTHAAGPSGAPLGAALSPDGARVAGAFADGVWIWSAESRAVARVIPLEGAGALAFSPDGQRVALGGAGEVRIIDAASGERVGRASVRGAPLQTAWSHDGAQLLVRTASEVVVLGPDGAARSALDAPAASGAAFLSDGRVVTAAGTRLTVWSSDGAKAVEGQAPVGTRALSAGPAGIFLALGEDGVLRAFSAETGAWICAALSVGGGFVVWDAAGRFDADKAGSEALALAAEGEIILLEQLRNRYYEPGLWAKHMGGDPEPLSEVRPFSTLALFPEVVVDPIDPKKPVLRVRLTNRGGGIGEVLVTLNGSDISGQIPRPDADPDVKSLTLELALDGLPYYKPGQENRVEIQAFNADGYLSSRGLDTRFEDEDAGPAEAPQFWAIVVGVHDYRGDTLDLRYPALDARAMHDALNLAAVELFGEANTHTWLLTTAEGDTRPTRQNLEAAFTEVARARPGDVVLVYLAGHGVSYDAGSGQEYYYLTPDFGAFEEIKDPATRAERTLSGTDLNTLLLQSPAEKRVLILDTCHSGQLIATLGGGTRAAASSQSRAFERMRERSGTYVLAGAAADAVSYETTRYGQGVLTYALLEGLRGAALQGDNVDVTALFSHARERVPQLATGIGGIQEPVVKLPESGSFDIGMLDVQDREKIPLQAGRPVIVRTSFLQQSDKLDDPLALSGAVNKQLTVVGAGADPAFVYFDTEDYPDGWRLSGRYVLGASGTTLLASLEHGEQIAAGFLLDAESQDAAALAEQLSFAVNAYFQGADATSLFGDEIGRVRVLSPEDLAGALQQLAEGAKPTQSWLVRVLTPPKGPCETGRDRTDLSMAIGMARLAFSRGQARRFEVAIDDAAESLRCLTEPLTPEDANAIHRVVGLQSWREGGDETALAYLYASHPAQAEYSFADPDADAPDEYGVLAANRTALLNFEPTLADELPPPARGKVTIDGQQRALLPQNTPYVFQLSTNSRVIETRYIHPGDPVPDYPKLRPRLLGVGLGALAVSAGLMGGAAYTNSLLLDEPEYRPDAEVQRLKGYNNLMFGASLASGAVAVGAGCVLGATYVW